MASEPWKLLLCAGCGAWQADMPDDDLDPCASCGSRQVQRVEVVPRSELKAMEEELLGSTTQIATEYRAEVMRLEAEVERLRGLARNACALAEQKDREIVELRCAANPGSAFFPDDRVADLRALISPAEAVS